MDHPYSGAAGYIYANEHPSTPVDPRPKNPYGKLPSFIPSPSTVTSTPTSRRSHDSGWSTEGTYTRTQRPQHDNNNPGPPLRRAVTQSAPRIPLRVPISHPFQQHVPSGSSWFAESPEDPHPFPLPHPHAPPHPTIRTSSLPAHSRPTSRPPSLKTTVTAPNLQIHPQVRSTSLPGHTRPRGTTNMKMTPYERDGDPLSLRRSAFVPYDHGSLDRESRDSSSAMDPGRMPWQKRIQVRSRRRIRRALKQLRRLIRRLNS
ncbi:hypothetical protein B0H12DRAFT_354862 [Mycena haematopus]|nr:hypothetical protein B0H12DRAFT_354862 [Mycena haematopus]